MDRCQKFQQQCEVGKQEDIDSLDDDSQSGSSAEPVLKKLKQLSDLMSVKSEKHDEINSSKFLKRKRVEKVNKVKIIMKHKKEAESECNRTYEGNYIGHEKSSGEDNINRKKGMCELASNFVYMQSILEELRVAGEELLIWMKGEMQKLLSETASKQIAEDHCAKWKIQHYNSKKSILNIQNCKREGPVKSADSVSVVRRETVGGNLGRFTKDVIFSTTPSYNVVPRSTACLSFPTVLKKKDHGGK